MCIRDSLYIFSDHWFVKFAEFDPSYTVLIPSVADSCISVGAFTSRSSWTDYRGSFHDDRTTIGDLANFSSHGPRIDGVMKPDITAPGRRLISCRNTDIIQLDGALAYVIISNNGQEGEPADYLALMGTSMSSPAAAGTAALMLQADPDLSPSDLRRLIRGSARTDEFTGETPNPSWGWGKIDVMRALCAPGVSTGEPAAPALIRLAAVYPNPFNGRLTVEYVAPAAGPVRLTLFDCTGREVWSRRDTAVRAGKHHITVTNLPASAGSGLYAVPDPPGRSE